MWDVRNGTLRAVATYLELLQLDGSGLIAVAAVAVRCYPLLPESEEAELEQLSAHYEPLTGKEKTEPAQAFFTPAPELWM